MFIQLEPRDPSVLFWWGPHPKPSQLSFSSTRAPSLKLLSHSITFRFRGLVLRSTATPRPIPKQAVASIQPQGTGVGPVLASRRAPFPSSAPAYHRRRTAKAESQAAVPGEVGSTSRLSAGLWACLGHRREGTSGLGRSLLRPRKQAKRRCHPLLCSWPDLTHTFIQQIFIKRLFVQGIFRRGGLQPGPRPPAPPRPAPPVAAPSAWERVRPDPTLGNAGSGPAW